MTTALKAAVAHGVVLSREYVEMFTAHLTSAGDTLRHLRRAPAKPS